MSESVLLLAGLGPYNKHDDYLNRTLFDFEYVDRQLGNKEYKNGGAVIDLQELYFEGQNGPTKLLRPRLGAIPHLATFTLESILRRCEVNFELFPLEEVWLNKNEPRCSTHGVIFLSTTFICDRNSLRRAIDWISQRFPSSKLVLGGQYSNLKYSEILRDFPSVNMIVLGDGEAAIPALLRCFTGRLSLDEVPNLAVRGDAGEVVRTAFQYIDFDTYPAPEVTDGTAVVPYESMRGCPFRCKFCSFPAASPLWRFRSADTIASDWARYKEASGARLIKSLDSTFTVPPARLRRLFELLPSVNIGWEAYTRANAIQDSQSVEALERAGCKTLSIGFESMSESVLQYMDKLVTAEENRRAERFLRDSGIDYRCSFIVGYPGESPRDFQYTNDYLVNEFKGRFMMSVFSLIDETMPVWQQKDRFRIEVFDEDDPAYSWRHLGMSADTAFRLKEQTLFSARWHSDNAVLLLWQMKYEFPLIPGVSHRQNQKIEKLLVRLAFLSKDFHDEQKVVLGTEKLLSELNGIGIRLGSQAPQYC